MKKKKSPWHPKYWPLHLGLGILHGLSLLPYRVKYQLGKIIGLILYYGNKQMRHVCDTNIAHCFPDKSLEQRKAITRKCFINLGRSFTDAISLAWLKSDKLNQLCGSVTGLEHVQQALDQGHGVMILFPHLMNMYMIGYLLLKKAGIPISLMYHSPRNPVLKKFAHQRLTKYCDKVFRRSDAKAMIEHLRLGNLVWYAPDLDPGRNHAVFVPFFGVTAATHTATARIARATQAKAIPIGFYRHKNKKFDIKFYPPLDNFPTQDDVQDALTINRAIEPIIREHPEQYLWQYRRFATVEPGKVSIYDEQHS